MNIALLTISSLSLAVSAATLTIVIVGGKKVEQKVEEARTKANATLDKVRWALSDLSL